MKKILFFMFFLSACIGQGNKKNARLVKDWNGRTILFPNNLVFSSMGKDTLNLLSSERDYTIVSYVDLNGCVNCKLRLDVWKDFLEKKDSIFGKNVLLVLVLHPRTKKEMVDLLKQHQFKYPICIDLNDRFNKLNNLVDDSNFHTFLLDRNDKIIAIGNLIHNPKVKELYFSLIKGEANRSNSEIMLTSLKIETPFINLGNFRWQGAQRAVFFLENVGSTPLVIHGVNASCGCISTSYSKKPTLPGERIRFEVTYKGSKPEHFNKTITLYCNALSSPVSLKIMGNAR